MKTFFVTGKATGDYAVYVKAESASDAMRKVENMLDDGYEPEVDISNFSIDSAEPSPFDRDYGRLYEERKQDET